MSDLVEWLRSHAQNEEMIDQHYTAVGKLMNEAADEIERLRKDAERYRYWRDKHGWTGYFDDGASNSEDNNDIDDAIDRAKEGSI